MLDDYLFNVFQYWGQGFEKMPSFLKIIYKHNLEFCEQHNINLVLIDDNNVNDYITPHPRFKELAYNFKSDIIRYYILHKFGGFWFDTDVIIIKDLNNLYKSIGKYECMLDVEFNEKIGCASMFIKKESNVSLFCINYINHVLNSKDKLIWDDIGPFTVEELYKTHFSLIKLNNYDIVKNGCNFVCWNEFPGVNKKNWYLQTEGYAMSKAAFLKNNQNCFYLITWTIYRINDMKNNLNNMVFNHKKSVFSYFINYENKKIVVVNAIDNEWNGTYCEGVVLYKDFGSLSYLKDDKHHIYLYNGFWKLGESGVKVYKQLSQEITNEIDLNIIKFDLKDHKIPDVRDITFLPEVALDNLKDNVLKTSKLNGIIIETGCAKGGSSVCIGYFKEKSKIFKIYDTFSLIPPHSTNDNKDCHDRYKKIISGEESKDYYGYQINLINTIKKTFDKFNLNIVENNIELIQGLYENTLKVNEPVSFAHIDCDWYDSVMVSLKEIEPNLVKGGILTLDDYYCWSGCKKACDDYFKDKKNNYLFEKKANRLNITKLNDKNESKQEKKYGVMWASTVNVGDDIQTIAGINFLEKKGIKKYSFIDREKLSDYNGEPVTLIMNGWYMHDINKFPPSNKITPIFISVHINNEFLIIKNINYFKKYEPIGCRDEDTANLFRKYGIKSYFSGCLTLLFDDYKEKTGGKYLVDINTKCNYIPNIEMDTLKYTDYEIIEHDINKNMSLTDRINMALILLNKYQKAELVITTRLHCILPCRAFNTKSIFIHKNYKNDPRFQGLKEIINGDINYHNNHDGNREKIEEIRNNFLNLKI
tara:strand:- start:1099 stop:3543 length:2445 start_codon:yes stop_codon:yes gene_type:complete